MLFIFSTPVLIRHLWQLKTLVSLHWCLICTVLLIETIGNYLLELTRSNKNFKYLDSLLDADVPGIIDLASLQLR